MRLPVLLTVFLSFFMQATIALAAEPLPMKEVADGVYVHQGVHEDLDEGYHGDIANIGFIVGSKGVAVIDTGGSLRIGKQLRDAVKEATALPILYVINTHVHPDHIFGNAAFLQDKPQFVGHEKLGHAMALRKDAYMRINQEWMGQDFAGSEIVQPSITVKDNLSLDLGDRKLELRAFPTAHTNTDVSVLDSKTSTLWTGDLLFVERTPSIDGDIKGWLSVLQTLKSSPAKKLVPGHGPVVDGSANAFANEERYLSTLLNDVRNSIKKGELMERAMDTAAASEKDQWQLFSTVNRRNVNLIYPALEWE
jgi:quinoprotein relay system zinc metallohydrolase 2